MLGGILILILSFILIALVSGNNLPVCSGSIIGSRIVSRRNGVLITIIGYILGLVLEGDMLRTGVNAVLPFKSEQSIIIAFAVAIFVFLIAHKMRVPQSLSVNFTSILLGISMAMHLPINWLFLSFIILFWIIAPIISVIAMRPLMHKTYSLVKKKKIWSTIKLIRLLLILFSFFAAFTLGANTLGLLYATMPKSLYSLLAALLGIIFGSLLLSGGELRRIGNEIISLRYINALNSQIVSVLLVELAVLLSIPLSNSQTFIASIYGSGLSYKNRILLRNPIKSIAITWIGGAFASFALAYLFAMLLA
ncbi:MAG: inorganic phosphate transporter [Candidatus Micrarchaeota archaeon]